MTLYYSAAKRGFYDSVIHAATGLPQDACAITATRHRELLAGQADGATIEPDAKGKPRLTRPSLEDRRAAAVRRIKREAARRIDAIAPIWRQLNDQRAPSDDGAMRFAAIDAVRAASDAIEADVATLSAAALDALDIARHPLWPAE